MFIPRVVHIKKNLIFFLVPCRDYSNLRHFFQKKRKIMKIDDHYNITRYFPVLPRFYSIHFISVKNIEQYIS